MERSMSCARNSQHGDKKNHESSKKLIDETYKNRRDSNSSRVNVLRAMIYSSLAYADSTRSIKNPSDPIDITYESINKIKNRDWDNYTAELQYIEQNLAATHIYKAKKALEKEDYAGAFQSYLEGKDLD